MNIWISCLKCDEVFSSSSRSALAYASGMEFEYCPKCGGKN